MARKEMKGIFSTIYGALDALKAGVQKLEAEIGEEPKRSFYPEVGTVFVSKTVGSTGPFIVEPQKDLSVATPGAVAFYDRVEGMGDWKDWLSDLRAGNIQVLWCPKHGSVGNEDYMHLWGLR